MTSFTWRRRCVAILSVAIAVAAATMAGTVAPARASVAGVELAPIYIYPGTQSVGGSTGVAIWNHICDTASVPASGPVATVIADPRTDGPISTDTNYTNALDYCADDGLNVIGYLDTNYGAKPESQLKTEIDNWKLYYPDVQGIMFDLVPSSHTATCYATSMTTESCTTYYSNLVSYVHSQISNSLAVGNPGTNTDTDWPLTMTHPFDIVNIFEGQYSTGSNPFTSWSKPSWLTGSEANSVSALIQQDNGTSDTASADASTFCTDIQNDGVGYGVAWTYDGSTWTSNPTNLGTGNGIWDHFVADGC